MYIALEKHRYENTPLKKSLNIFQRNCGHRAGIQQAKKNLQTAWAKAG